LSSPRRCRGCKTWRGCEGYDWFEMSEIEDHYCALQVIWVLVNLLSLDAGSSYPKDPTPTGYVDHGFGGIRAQAPFEHLARIRAEVDWRIKQAVSGKHDDGDTLRHDVVVLNVRKVFDLSRPARDALHYVCGKNRRLLPYRDWLNQRMRRANNEGRDPSQKEITPEFKR
jgi:hypothetical protein